MCGVIVFFDTGLGLIVLDELPEALTRHPFPADVDEQRLFIRRSDHLRANEVDVFCKGTHSRRIHGDHARLVAALAADHTCRQIHVRDVQRDQLADADAGRIQQLKHGAVTVALGVRTLRLRQQQLDLLLDRICGSFCLALSGTSLPVGLCCT